MSNARVNEQLREAWVNENPNVRVNQLFREAWVSLQVLSIGVIAATQIDAYPPGGNASFVRFRLRGFAGFVPRAPLPATVIVTITAALGTGTISQNIIPNTVIYPSGTFYTIEAWSNGRVTASANVTITASADLSTLL
jgi:hypothetical protein